MPSLFSRGAVRTAVLASVSVTGLLCAGVTAHASGKKASQTTIESTDRANVPTPGVQPVLGNVTPDRAGEHVVVKYFHRHSGSWVLKATKRGKLDAGPSGPGSYFVEVKAQNKGTCKLVVTYPGDSTYAASHARKVITCSTGLPKG